MKGYKVFCSDWTCLGFQYEVGKTYEMDATEIKLCNRGFHFCKRLVDCFSYYGFDRNYIENCLSDGRYYDMILRWVGKTATEIIKIIQ